MKAIWVFIFLCLTRQGLVAQDSTYIQENKPFVLGTIVVMHSQLLSEKRVLNIYLPEGYDQDASIKYPVIYLLDGSADEDFIHVVGIVQFLTFPWINSLPKSIVVGIANVDRKRDFTYPTRIEKDKTDFPTTGKSANFIGFIEDELQPFIESTYKANTSRTMIGQSLGGLLATEILFKKPHLFNNYIIVSPSLWWDHESLLKVRPRYLDPAFTCKVSVFVAVGKEGKVMEDDSKKLAGILAGAKRQNITVDMEYFTNENHASILHNAVYKGLEKINKNARTKSR